jgi:NAD(P)-dependent dehydrogenase (short-subunit alcohol dehydrogenase family)
VLTSSIAGLYGGRNTTNYSMAKSSMIGLANVAAIEGAEEGVKSNVILPGALTRMAEGLDTSAYPPMDPELAAPVVGWLSHESCSISGEILTSMAGRNARAYIAESQGVYRPTWTIEQVAENMAAIRSTEAPVIFPVVPLGQGAHIGYSFEMARRGAK